MEDRIKQLESKIEKLETIITEHFKYSPDGDGATDAKKHFDSLANN